MRLVLALCAVLGFAAGSTAAAFTDHARFQFSPITGTYDIAFLDAQGAVQQGNPTVFQIDATNLPPVNQIGEAPASTLVLKLQNAGSSPSGTVILSAKSLLTGIAADADGHTRDPFTVLLVTVSDGSTVLASDQPLSQLAASIPEWAPGTAKELTITFSYPASLDSPFWRGKDVRIGLIAAGISS